MLRSGSCRLRQNHAAPPDLLHLRLPAPSSFSSFSPYHYLLASSRLYLCLVAYSVT